MAAWIAVTQNRTATMARIKENHTGPNGQDREPVPSVRQRVWQLIYAARLNNSYGDMAF